MAEPAASLDPGGYPWTPVRGSGVLVDGHFEVTAEIDDVLDTHGASPMRSRHRVLAVGSNASADVMDRKMARVGVRSPLPMTVVRHDGIAVGHSAHVSLPGFIAAAPYRCGRCSRRFVMVHPDDEQVEALDATEPNYVRTDHDGAWLYASRWQVLAHDGMPVTLRPQADLHRTLAEIDERFRERFAERMPADVTGMLAHDGSVNEWRQHWQAAGFTRHAGFDLDPT